jgi:DHA2 family multidrug resistance protein
MSQAILMETFPPKERGLAMGIFGIGVVVGPILGPLLGGYLTDNYSWRWIFYINLPIGLMATFMVMSFIEDPPYMDRWQKGMKVDYVGLTLLSLGLGCLQIVLDKGQLEDWFESSFILALSVIATVCLVGLVFWELRQENPILDLRVFKDRSFAVGNLIMFLSFFAFFGSVVLLPMYLQQLMGYTAFLAGVVLGPGGALTLVMMPIVGKLTQRFDARALLGVGLLVTAASLFYMADFNLQIDLTAAITGRLIQGVGMPFLFVTMAYATLAYVPNEKMNNASAIFNLLRNLGGSFGVAFITTLLARRAQFHQSRLSESLTELDPTFYYQFQELKQALTAKLGQFVDTSHLALAYIYKQTVRQATTLAFCDVFYVQGLIFLSLVATLWIMRKPPSVRKPMGGGH